MECPREPTEKLHAAARDERSQIRASNWGLRNLLSPDKIEEVNPTLKHSPGLQILIEKRKAAVSLIFEAQVKLYLMMWTAGLQAKRERPGQVQVHINHLQFHKS